MNERDLAKRDLVLLPDDEATAALNRGEVRRTGLLLHDRPLYEILKSVVHVVEEVVDVVEAVADLVAKPQKRKRSSKK